MPLGDADDGPNGLQNFPVITSAAPGAATALAGTLDSRPNTYFVLDFYASASADPSGFGEGQRWLGSIVVTTDPLGQLDFNVLLQAGTAAGERVTATATRLEDTTLRRLDTSEFSAAVLL